MKKKAVLFRLYVYIINIYVCACIHINEKANIYIYNILMAVGNVLHVFNVNV